MWGPCVGGAVVGSKVLGVLDAVAAANDGLC